MFLIEVQGLQDKIFAKSLGTAKNCVKRSFISFLLMRHRGIRSPAEAWCRRSVSCLVPSSTPTIRPSKMVLKQGKWTHCLWSPSAHFLLLARQLTGPEAPAPWVVTLPPGLTWVPGPSPRALTAGRGPGIGELLEKTPGLTLMSCLG